MPAFPGVDFLDFDSLLNDEELLARKTARQFVDEHVIPIIEKHNREATFPHGAGAADWASWDFLARTWKGYGCAGDVQRRLWPGDAGTRTRRFRPAQLRFRAERAGDVSRSTRTARREQKDKWLPRLQSGKAVGCFGLTEPQFGSNPERHADARGEERRSLHPQRRKNVDHQRIDRRCRAGLGEMRGRQHSRLSGGKRHEGFQGLGCARKAFAARFRHFRPGDERLRNSRGKCASRRGGLERPAQLPDAGALRHRLGSDRRGDGLLRHGAAIRENAQAISEQAHRVAPARAGQAGFHDHGNFQGAAAGAARRQTKRSKPAGSRRTSPC